MSGPGLAAVLLVIGIVLLVVSFWRQIIAFVLLLILIVFCFGVYYIVSLIEDMIS
jgi:uncharacterized membrane protein